jgi:hypothetical protein
MLKKTQVKIAIAPHKTTIFKFNSIKILFDNV